MDFNKLMSRMRELDQPVSATAVEACGDPMGMPSPMSPPMGQMDQQPPAHPSMSLNLNAQGMDNIESLMKLMTRVNPDMINQKSPLDAMPGAMAMLTPPGPSITSIGDLGDLDKGPLKMLPDLDSDNDNKPGGEMGMEQPSEMDLDSEEGPDDVNTAHGDIDNDGDHDMDDHDMEKDDADDNKKEKDEAFGNSAPGAEGPSTFDIDAAIPDGDDLNKPKQMHKHSYKQGDNPMAMEGSDLRAAIRAELLQRLAEAKGAK
jgi:hypothetical protein